MGSILFMLCALALLSRGDVSLLLSARPRSMGFMQFVSTHQRAMARKLFSLAGIIGGLRTDFHRFKGPLPPVFMILSNHQSIADIPALAINFPRHGLRYVAKRSLRRGIPYISRTLRIGRSALVSRTGDFGQGQAELRKLGSLSLQGICPVVFPEGTRSRTGRLGEFFTGAVRLILERYPMPVLSVAVDGGHSIATVSKLLLHLRGTLYRVKPLTLYPTPHGKREIADVLGKVRSEISDQVDEWRREGRA
jgi:1-acyl-sn-glycerol-3-phosphate acyltransferase